MSFIFPVAAFILLIGADRLTKYLAAAKLAGSGEIPLIDGLFSLTYVENQGAAFGMLQGARWYFVVITVIVMSVILYYYLKLPRVKPYAYVRASLVFIAAGAIGNFIDRLLQGYVVDFLYFKPFNFPVFNVADICVVCGTIALAALLLFFVKEGAPEEWKQS